MKISIGGDTLQKKKTLKMLESDFHFVSFKCKYFVDVSGLYLQVLMMTVAC